MNENFAKNDGEIDIKHFILLIWKKKILISSLTFFAALLAFLFSFLLPIKYTSSTLLAPVEPNSFSNALAGAYGGLAGLAGIDLPEQSASRTDLAIEILQSRSFLNELIKRRDIEPELFYAAGWDESNDVLIFSSDFNDENNEWEGKPLLKNEILKEWNEELINISKDVTTNFITIEVTHYSPKFAYELLNWILLDLDEEVRKRDMDASTKAVEYLQQELSEIETVELRDLFFSLIKDQTNKKMLAKTNPEYVFTVIDPPYVPDENSEPKRFLLVLSIAILIFLGSLICVPLFLTKRL